MPPSLLIIGTMLSGAAAVIGLDHEATSAV